MSRHKARWKPKPPTAAHRLDGGRWSGCVVRLALIRPEIKHLLADVLREVFDVLHRFANARSGRLVTADGLVNVFARLFDHAFELFVLFQDSISLGSSE